MAETQAQDRARSAPLADRSVVAALPLLLSVVMLPMAWPDPGVPRAVSAEAAAARTGQSDGLSHLLPHLLARPPGELLRPLGDESPEAIVKGYDPPRERVLTDALLAAGLHSRILRVGIASNGSLTAGLVKLQAGDKQSGLFSVADIERDASRTIVRAFDALPELGHLDLWATVPWQRDFAPVHRPVFALSVPRDRIRDLLGRSEDPDAILARCGGIRVEAAFLDHAIDGPNTASVLPLTGDVLAGPGIDRDWLAFGRRAQASGELDDLPAEGPVQVVFGGPITTPAACLTIDDGPHPLLTPLVLDILRREGVKATFFLVGEQVEQYPELARMIARDGHELANHTYSHSPLSQVNPRGVWAQVRAADEAVERACDVRMRWFRPPGGDCTEQTLRVVSRLGYATVMWTANTGDWSGIGANQITANALAGLRPGAVILMHQDSLESMAALGGIIQGAREAGITLGTVGEVAGEEAVTEVAPEEVVPLMRQSRIDR